MSAKLEPQLPVGAEAVAAHRCCFCIPLRTGVMIIATFTLIDAFVQVFSTAYSGWWLSWFLFAG